MRPFKILVLTNMLILFMTALLIGIVTIFISQCVFCFNKVKKKWYAQREKYLRQIEGPPTRTVFLTVKSGYITSTGVCAFYPSFYIHY
jgi:hypothetical protein